MWKGIGVESAALGNNLTCIGGIRCKKQNLL